ncbi:MAG: hypothetical protein JKY54_13325 [Flavobacteriales bacterium]|nr:hypothetical protein [Flavobacteriales bacterium]
MPKTILLIVAICLHLVCNAQAATSKLPSPVLNDKLEIISWDLGYRNILKAFGKPDSVIEKPYNYTKQLARTICRYDKLGVRFMFMEESKKLRKSKLKLCSIQLDGSSDLRLNGIPINQLDTNVARTTFGDLQIDYSFNELTLTYIFSSKGIAIDLNYDNEGKLEEVLVYKSFSRKYNF